MNKKLKNLNHYKWIKKDFMKIKSTIITLFLKKILDLKMKFNLKLEILLS